MPASLLALLPLALSFAAPSATLEGRLTAPYGLDPSRVVVYLVPSDGRRAPLTARRITVSQKNARFKPELLVVPRGSTIDFVNDDRIDHNVFSFSDAKKFNLGIYPAPGKRSVTFDKEGPVFFFCSIHENMNGVVYVAPTELFAVTGEDGRFRVEGLEPGRYELRTWSARWPELRSKVVIPANAAGHPVQLQLDLGQALEGKVVLR